MTEVIKINPAKIERTLIRRGAKLIQSGELVAFPTETVYGLGANAFSSDSILKIFQVKNRPADNPLIVHVSSMKMLKEVVGKITPLARKLIKKYWPGPLTLVLEKSIKIPDSVSCGLKTVAVRMPDNKIAFELIKESGVPIAAPSANLSTSPSPTSAEHVFYDLNGRINMIIDGGLCDIGLESTVLDISGKVPRLLRPGKVGLEELREFLGEVESNFSSEKPSSPGMKYKHYSPKTRVVLSSSKNLLANVDRLHKDGEKVAVLSFNKYNLKSEFIFCFNCNLELMAREIFRLFRELDKQNYDVILVEEVEERGLGLAIMNRLKKAAAK